MSLEIARIDRRTRGSIVASVIVHAVLALLFCLLPKPNAMEMSVIEVTWVDAVVLEPPAASAAEAVVEERIEQIRPATRESKVHFARETEASIAPRPQNSDATRDRLRDRLASLQENAVSAPRAATMAGTSLAVLSGFGGVPSGTSKSGPAALTRGDGPNEAPIELTRGRRMPGPSAPVLQRAQEQAERKEEPQALAAGSSTREVLSGIRISGPVADRPLITYRAPIYPEWAQREMVEGSVRLHFNVLPDGSVKENIFVEKTSGFEDFDENAVRALALWRFEPLARGVVGEQWGSIVFDYKLSEAEVK